MAMHLAPASTRQHISTVYNNTRLSDVNSGGSNPFIEKLVVQICKHFYDQHLIDASFKFSHTTSCVTAHRLILSAASPYFNELFQSGTNAKIIEIKDIKAVQNLVANGLAT